LFIFFRDEDKKEIGTIRRYGIGADVMIMYGGELKFIYFLKNMSAFIYRFIGGFALPQD